MALQQAIYSSIRWTLRLTVCQYYPIFNLLFWGEILEAKFQMSTNPANIDVAASRVKLYRWKEDIDEFQETQSTLRNTMKPRLRSFPVFSLLSRKVSFITPARRTESDLDMAEAIKNHDLTNFSMSDLRYIFRYSAHNNTSYSSSVNVLNMIGMPLFGLFNSSRINFTNNF